MREAILNLRRKKLRTLLGICGIAAGIFTFITFGAISEHFRYVLEHFRLAFSGRLFLCEKPSFWAGGGLISEEKVHLIKGIEDVEDAIPILVGRLRRNQTFMLGIPDTLVGVPVEKINLYLGSAALQEGCLPTPGGRQAVIGEEIARKFDLRCAEIFHLDRGEVKVAGILRRTGSFQDRQVIFDLALAQEFLSREGLITAIILLPKGGASLEAISSRVRKVLPWMEVLTSQDLAKSLAEDLGLMHLLSLFLLILAGVSSGLVVFVTMSLAGAERIQEIGLKKALGATGVQILSEYLIEALLLSISGMVAGYFGAVLFVAGLDRLGGIRAGSIFTLTFRLFLAATLWTVIIGVASGYFPSRQASLIDPVEAMRG